MKGISVILALAIAIQAVAAAGTFVECDTGVFGTDLCWGDVCAFWP